MTALPAPFHRTPLVPMDDVAVLWGYHVDHAEGVAADLAADGTAVVWAGGEDGQVYRQALAALTADGPGDADGDPAVAARVAGRLLGVCIDGGGAAYLAGESPAAIHRVTPDGTATVLATAVGGRPLVLPNHPGLLPDGTLLCTDSGTWERRDGRTVFLRPDGSGGIADETAVDFPNGLCVTPDGAHVYVVESVPPRLVRLEAEPGGRLGGRQVVTELPGVVPDGVVLTADGRLVVTCFAPDALLMVDPDEPSGTYHVIAHDPLRFVLHGPTNAAFVPGTTTLITANYGERALARLVLDVAGAATPRPDLSTFEPLGTP